jgi:hypothetical protein
LFMNCFKLCQMNAKQTIKRCVRVNSERALDYLHEFDTLQVTLQNEENNMYLLTYKDGIIVDTLVRLFKVCDSELTRYPVYSMTDKESVGYVIKECLIAILKVLINLTHDFNNKCELGVDLILTYRKISFCSNELR